MSRHNHTKHWVDDVNNRRHDPIGLEEVRATKWWPHRQFTFICSIAEVNALYARARGRSKPAEAGLIFRRKLAEQMLTNKIMDSGHVCHSPITPSRKHRGYSAVEHKLVKKPPFTGKWDLMISDWRRVSTKYLKEKCYWCNLMICTHCLCAKQTTMCGICFGNHMVKINNTS